MNNGSIFGTKDVTGSGVLQAESGDTVLEANDARIAFTIVNLNNSVLYVKFGEGADSTTAYDIPLKACTAANDGTGGSLSMESGTVYTGAISVAGTSPRLSIIEFAP